MKVADILLEHEDVAVGDRRPDMGEERGKDDAVLAVDSGVGRLGRFVGGRRVVLFVQRRLPDPDSAKDSGSGLARMMSEYQTK